MKLKLSRAIALGLLLCGASNTQSQAAAPTAPQGVITEEVFLDIGGGTTIADLTGNAKFTAGTPDTVNYRKYFEYQAGGDITVAAPSDVINNAGARMAGYFYPPATGDYIFFVCADDAGQLFLSTDDNPANKKLIAEETGWSGNRNYTGIGGGSTVEAKNSQTYTATQWPTKDAGTGGAKITLTKGKAYYIEALEKEGGGGDDLSVAVQDPNGAIDSTMPIPGEYLSSYDKQTGPLVIETQPKSLTVNALDAATFKIVLNGTPPYTYQWQKNGADIPGATTAVYSIARTTAADNNSKFLVKVTGANGSATSAEVVLTVNFDSTPPTLAKVTGSASFTSLTLKFSEPLDPATATAAANYKLSGGLTVSAAAQSAAPNDDTVVLTTSKQSEGATLTLTVSNIKDLAGNVMATTTKDIVTAMFATGFADYSRWNYAADPGAVTVLVDGLAAGTMPSPDIETAVSQFGGPWGVGDNYFARVFGFFVPPSNGNYVFFVAADDQVNLYLSTDSNPANKKLIAQEGGWSNQYQWITPGSGDASTKRSDQFSSTEWPDGLTITLKAGTKYYIEMLHKEGGGGDGSDVTFIKEGEADPAQSAAGMLMVGNVIGTYVDVNGAKVDITTPPASVQGVDGKTATFKVVADVASPISSTASYQWLKNGAAIAGATKSSYTTPLLTMADNNTKYSVTVSVPGLSKTSPEAVLTVVADTFPPVITGAGAVQYASATGPTGAFDVGIEFDETINATTAGVTANYTLSAGTIVSVTAYTNAGVVIRANGLTVGTKYTVTVKNVADLKGNTITSASQDFTPGKMTWGVVGANELGFGNGVLAVGSNGFDVFSDGIGEWATYDEATFVYEQVTGDFDKKLRVEYQDSSSQWARAGLIARDVTNFGVDRAAQATDAGRYQKVHVNPVTTAMGTAGNNSWEGNRRLTTGAETTSAGGGGVPLYPNAWCRMQRVGQVFTIFRSDDGVTWTQLGTTTFDPPMPDTLFVGPEYTPENGNVTDGLDLRGIWLAKFRDYGDYVIESPKPVMTFQKTSTGLIITFEGTLQSVDAITGAWTDVAGATSPYTATATGGTVKFFRAKK